MKQKTVVPFAGLTPACGAGQDLGGNEGRKAHKKERAWS